MIVWIETSHTFKWRVYQQKHTNFGLVETPWTLPSTILQFVDHISEVKIAYAYIFWVPERNESRWGPYHSNFSHCQNALGTQCIVLMKDFSSANKEWIDSLNWNFTYVHMKSVPTKPKNVLANRNRPLLSNDKTY